ncbi:DUF433 domain-containing protein [Candidatus Poribacteria bacterium]|nr:DUF433 domain-containing protein [Candidatus Poribacteria bacterium]
MPIQYETPRQLRYILETEIYRLKDAYQIETDAVAKLAEELSQALFNATGLHEGASQVENHYQYLEPKPYKKTKQLGIKGRNMTVWNLVGTMRTEGFTIEEVAEDFRLPVEAVAEALDYYYKNREMIEAENEQIGRQLGLIKD